MDGPTDRVEDTVAWVLASMLLVAAVAAVLVGAHAHADALALAGVQRTERTQVTGASRRPVPRTGR